MFLEASPASLASVLAPLQGAARDNFQDSFYWLIDEVGVQYDGRCELSGPPEELMLGSSTNVASPLDKSKKASWRKMKLHRVMNQGAIELKFCTDGGTILPAHILDEDQETTLGKLHDGLQKLMPVLEDFDLCETMEQWGVFPTRELILLRKRIRKQCALDKLWEDDPPEEDDFEDG